MRMIIGAMVLAVGGFAATVHAAAGALRVGAVRFDITPAANRENLPMNEYQHERLYLRAIVIDDGQNPAALIGADLGGINEDVWADASRQIAAKLGAPEAISIIAATHM